MLFASFPFILVYLPIVIVACIALQRLIGPKAAQAWILVASVFFYATSKPFNLVLILHRYSPIGSSRDGSNTPTNR